MTDPGPPPNTMPIPSSAAPGPVTAGERIESIDVLRGVAVLGILALNIQSFAMPGAAYMNPTAYGDFEGVNYWIWYVVHLLGDLKFWTIFSMLFGAGIVIMTTRCEATGRSAAGVHYRRMGWLLLIGLLHAHLIWYGDILYTYAMCGLAVYLFRRMPPWALITVGLILLLFAFGIALGFGWLVASETIPQMNEQMNEAWSPSEPRILHEIEIYRGGWLEQLPHRAISAVFFQTFLFLINTAWRSGGLMLIGMALYKLGVFSAERSKAFYASLIALALFVGLPLIAYGAQRNIEAGWSVEYSFHLGPLYNFWASILVSLGWVGLVMLVCKTVPLRPITRPFAAAGRMALTCYLLESIIATAIFYGHGFGRFGHFERWQQALTVLAIWAFLLVFAVAWLRFFRFGPFEWLWRSLTYMRPQPMRR